MKQISFWRFVPHLFASIIIFLVQQQDAAAQFSVSSPKVEQGELEVETHGSFQSGLPQSEEEEDEAIRQGHEIAVGYGITSFWKAEVGLTLQKPAGEELEATAFEIENTLQLATFERLNATFGVLAAVSFGIEGDEPNAFEVGPLVQFGDEKRSLILNGIFEKTFGDNREDGVGFEYAARAKFEIMPSISLGGEAFGEIENLGDAPPFDETELRVGPVLFYSSDSDDDDLKGGKADDDDKSLKDGDKEPEITAAFGVLFGATNATPDVTVKWDLEVAF